MKAIPIVVCHLLCCGVSMAQVEIRVLGPSDTVPAKALTLVASKSKLLSDIMGRQIPVAKLEKMLSDGTITDVFVTFEDRDTVTIAELGKSMDMLSGAIKKDRKLSIYLSLNLTMPPSGDGTAVGPLGRIPAQSQPLDGKKKDAIFAFAERFVVACSDKDLPTLTKMSSFPFTAYVVCKGGPHDSAEEFRDNILARGDGVKSAKSYNKRYIMLPEKYFSHFPLEFYFGSQEERRTHVKSLGQEVYVVCLVQDIKSDFGGIAVLVRATKNELRAIGIGYLVPEALEP